MNVVFGVLLSVPEIVVCPAAETTDVMTGKFCRLFGPLSASPGLLGVTPLGTRSIPSRRFEKIELPRIELPEVKPMISIPLTPISPLGPLNAMTLPAPGAEPPIVVLTADEIRTP